MARVSCSDEVWAEFKRLAQTDGWQPVNEYLGALVAKEVAYQNRLRARAEDTTARQVLATLDQVKELHSDLEGLTARLESLAAKKATPAPAPVARTAEGVPLSGDWTAYRRDGGVDPADVPDWEE